MPMAASRLRYDYSIINVSVPVCHTNLVEFKNHGRIFAPLTRPLRMTSEVAIPESLGSHIRATRVGRGRGEEQGWTG